MRSHHYFFLACLLAVFALSACGGSGDGATSSVTKAEFIKQADAVCKKENKERIAFVDAFSKEHNLGPGQEMTKDLFEELALNKLLPLVQQQAEQLREMQMPADAEAQIKSILTGLEAAVKKAESSPSSVLDTETSPFASTNKMSLDFGFKICAQY